jgi:hypothetical protein
MNRLLAGVEVVNELLGDHAPAVRRVPHGAGFAVGLSRPEPHPFGDPVTGAPGLTFGKILHEVTARALPIFRGLLLELVNSVGFTHPLAKRLVSIIRL